MSSKFDDLLTRLGTGRWNLMYFLSACYWYLLLPAQTFNVVFLAPALNFTCRPPQRDDLLVQVAQDSCSYTVNRSSLASLEEEPCTEWDFDTSVFSSTLTSEVWTEGGGGGVDGDLRLHLRCHLLRHRVRGHPCSPLHYGLSLVSHTLHALLLNESPRWLIVRGHHKQALHALKRAARLNHSSLPPEDELRLMMLDIQAEAEMDRTKSLGNMKESLGKKRWYSFNTPALFSTPKMRLITLTQSLNIFTCSLVYCGLSLSGDTYSADPFLYIIISGLMEVPGYTVTAPIIARWGRKQPIIAGWFLSGTSILALAFTPSDISWLVMLLAMIGKLAISAVFMIVFVYEAELLPTEVRLQGVAVVFVAGQIAATCSPYLADFLGPLVPWLPSVIFGVMSFLTGFSVFPLPETLGMALPDTISDLEELFNQKKSNKADDKEELEKLQA